MIRLVHLLKHAPDIGLQQFSDYWRDEHGPLVASHQARLGLLRHVQTHRDLSGQDLDLKAGKVRGGVEPPYDGIAEYWWASEQELRTALATVAGQKAQAELIASERRFVDLAASPLWFAHEYPQVATALQRPVALPKSGVTKLNFALRPLPGQTVAEAQAYWLTSHGPLVRSHSGARGLLGYYQVHRYETSLAAEFEAGRGTRAESYMGHAEAWSDRLSPREGPEMQAATDAAVADERNFIDWRRSTIFVGKELVFVNRDWI